MGDLSGGIAVGHGDVYVPSLPRETLFAPGEAQRSMLTYERASQFDDGRTLPQAYAWSRPFRRRCWIATISPFGPARPPRPPQGRVIYRRRYMLSPWTSFSLRRSPVCRASWRDICSDTVTFRPETDMIRDPGLCPNSVGKPFVVML